MEFESSRATKWLFLVVAPLSLPLCLLPFLAWTAASIPWLTTELTVANETGESIFITLSTLPSLDGDVLTAVNSANRFSFDVRFWAGMLLATAAGGVPFALFLLWFRHYRRPRNA